VARHLRPGDCVIYRKQKHSAHPGPHAKDIHPAASGDTYTYCVPKFYRVVAVQPDHAIVVRTRRGRLRTLAPPGAALRRAHWWERLFFAARFPPPAVYTGPTRAVAQDKTFMCLVKLFEPPA
jgi:hypothetical protein